MKQHVPYEQTLSQRDRRDRSRAVGRRMAKEILLLCTTVSMSPGDKERLSQILNGPVDWEYLLDLAAFHGIMPLVSHNLVANGLSPQVPQLCLDHLKRGYSHTLYRNVILAHELADVLSTFNQHGIETISLKGAALTDVLYGNPSLRPMADTDILIHPKDISLARALLGELGYEQTAPRQQREHPFHEEPFFKKTSFVLFLELHWGLDDNKLVDFPENEIWRRAQPLWLQEVPTLIMSPEDNLLFIANHLPKHDTELLKFLADIAQLLKKYDGALDWDYIIESAHSWHIAPAVYFSLRRARDLIGASVPLPVLEALRPEVWRWWLIDLLLDEESFVSPIRWSRLRGETSTLARCLMMRRPRQMLAFLSRLNHESGKRGAWMRRGLWVMLVVVATLARHWARFGAKLRFSFLSQRLQKGNLS